MKALRDGQCLRHERYGIGIATTSNDERTTIDFYEHGRKVFVTALLQAELVAEAPARIKPKAAKGTKKKSPIKEAETP